VKNKFTADESLGQSEDRMDAVKTLCERGREGDFSLNRSVGQRQGDYSEDSV
jgi:hypothetical protein